MQSARVEEFSESLAGTAPVEVVEAGEFRDVLPAAIDEPAIGVELPFEGLSLEPTAVETEFGPDELESARTGVTPAMFGIAEYGTVTLPTDSAGTELVSLYPPSHVAVLRASDIQQGMKDSFERLEAAFDVGADTHVLATGPSATADMGTLVEGVHGPGDVRVVVLEDR